MRYYKQSSIYVRADMMSTLPNQNSIVKLLLYDYMQYLNITLKIHTLHAYDKPKINFCYLALKKKTCIICCKIQYYLLTAAKT